MEGHAPQKRDLYDILGVPRNATISAIRGAFRNKAMTEHPDKGGDPRRFAALQESYSVLSNNVARKHYDETGRTQMTTEEQLKSNLDGFFPRERERGAPDQEQRPAGKASPAARPGVTPFCRQRSRSPSPAVPSQASSSSRSPQPGRERAAQSRKAKGKKPSITLAEVLGDEAAESRQKESQGAQKTSSSNPSSGRLRELGAELQKAIDQKNQAAEDEDYDAAAEIKKRIKAIEAQIAQLGGVAPKEVLAKFMKPVTHIAVWGLTTKSLQVTEMYPQIKDGKLQAGQVLLQMRALPISFADLMVDGRYDPGDFYGWQGIAQVLLLGPQVSNLQIGDWVVPLQEVDDEGDLLEDAEPTATGRTIAVFPAKSCLKLIYSATSDMVFTIPQLALAKSIGAARLMVEQYTGHLSENDTVIVNAANGVVGQLLVQMLVIFKYRVFAVIREYADKKALAEVTNRLVSYGAAKVLHDDDAMKSKIEAMEVPLPELAFDGVGSGGTTRIAATLSKKGDLVCYNLASKQVMLQGGWAKKWKGTCHRFCFDEWVQEDFELHTEKFNTMMTYMKDLIRAGRLKFEVSEYCIDEFDKALTACKLKGRTSAVVLQLPGLDSQQAQASPQKPLQQTNARPPAGRSMTKEERERTRTNFSWDTAFLAWEKHEENDVKKREEIESNLFQPDPIMEEMRIQRYVDDSLATHVALELGAKLGEARWVIFWLPGAGEVPEEHVPWLSRLCSETPGLRALVLKPPIGTKWFDLTDYDCVKLGLRFAIEDDDYFTTNIEGDFMKSQGNITFGVLETRESEAVQQVESAAIRLARRATIEETALRSRSNHGLSNQLPFFFGGFGQGGSVALYTACCLMKTPIMGVAFCHSGVPCGSMIGKRITERQRDYMKMYAIYDKADNQVPPVFAEAFTHMLDLTNCNVSLHWLNAGDGHEFVHDAADKVCACFKDCLEGPAPREKAATKPANGTDNFHPALPTGYLPQRFQRQGEAMNASSQHMMNAARGPPRAA